MLWTKNKFIHSIWRHIYNDIIYLIEKKKTIIANHRFYLNNILFNTIYRMDIFTLRTVIGLINQLHCNLTDCSMSVNFTVIWLYFSADQLQLISVAWPSAFYQVLARSTPISLGPNFKWCRFDFKPALSIATIRLDLNKANQRSAHWKLLSNQTWTWKNTDSFKI